jgi:N,N'-diacetyllegionaminate synthase
MNYNNIKFLNHNIGKNEPVFIIAEIGATHDGDINQALSLIEIAKKSGAQAVKLQTVTPDYSYCSGTLSHDVFQELSLNIEEMQKMKKVAEDLGLIIFSTPGDFPSLEMVQKLDFPIMKISSGLMTNKPLVEAVAKTKKPLIISSGMAYLDEIARTVRFAKEAGAKQLAVLHCTSVYPCEDKMVNLKAINTMEKSLNLPIGYSDHTADELACGFAVMKGAVIIEKHLALSHKLAGPEKGTACDPEQFIKMVTNVRRAEQMQGSGIKAPHTEENLGRKLHRRSLISVKSIPKGKIIEEGDISITRGTLEHIGASPELYNDIIGLRANRDIVKNEPIKIGMFSNIN